MSKSPQDLYAKKMLLSYGYPLWYPEPKPGLPPSYEENGLYIGDVGYVDGEGMFEVLFNICFLEDHELHQDKDLSGLEIGRIKFNPNEVPHIRDALPAGRAVCPGVQGPQGVILKHNTQGCAPCEFVTYSTSGAMLILPSGAVRQNLNDRQEKEFFELAKECAPKWCQFAGRQSLYLITGFHKTSSWHLASFQGIRPKGQTLLTRDNTGGFIWDSRCDYRDSRETKNENQTVFISGFKIEVRGKSQRPVVKKLQIARSLLGVLVSFWQQMVSEIAPKLGVRISRVPASSQPFHPSDIINRYLLDKNPNVPVAITHDSQWHIMLEEGELSHEVMLDEGRFRVFLDGKYADHLISDNVVYLQRRETNYEGDDGLRKSELSPEIFTNPTLSVNTRRFIITRMRVENVVTCLERMPVGFYVLIQFNSTERRSKCKPGILLHHSIEWDDKIVLPTDLTVEVQLSVIASFEFEPMLGSGETLCTLKRSMDSLVEGGGTNIPWGENASLLITCEEWRIDPHADWGHSDMNLRREDNLYIQIAEKTDRGHNALLCYRRGDGLERLEECIKCFKHALDHCRPELGCYAVTLFNYATAMFINSRVYGRTSDLDVAINSYRKALALRLDPHSDRPGTLLHLAQALLYGQGRLQRAASVSSEIEELSIEIKQLCSEDRYEHRAADLVIQMLKQYRVLASGELGQLDELVEELDRSARTPLDWHFDKPHRLINFGTALRKRFDITGDLGYLSRSISTMENAVDLVSDSHLDKPWILTSLGDALYVRFVRRSDVADLDRSISMIEAAVKLTQDGHIDKPRMLVSLSDALRARFAHGGALVDLNSSISMMDAAVKLFPADHIDKPWMLTRLGVAFLVRFIHGNVSGLTKSIFVTESVLHLIPQAPLGQRDNLAILSIGDPGDLEQAISRHRDALKLLDGDPHKSDCLTNLASSLLIRYWCLHYPSDLEEAVSTYKDIVHLIPNGHPDKPKCLNNLALSLRARFERLVELGDLDDAISMYKDAAEFTPDDHPDKLSYLNSMVDCVFTRFEHSRDLRDLEEAISSHRMQPTLHVSPP